MSLITKSGSTSVTSAIAAEDLDRSPLKSMDEELVESSSSSEEDSPYFEMGCSSDSRPSQYTNQSHCGESSRRRRFFNVFVSSQFQDLYHTFSDHRYHGSYCGLKRPPLPPIESFGEAARVMDQILRRGVLCRHDVDDISAIYKQVDLWEREMEHIPEPNSDSILQKIIIKIQAILSSQPPSPDDLITAYHFSRFYPLDFPTVSLAARAREKIAQHSQWNPGGQPRDIASKLPCCGSEDIFNQDIKALLGEQVSPEITEMLEKKKKALKNHEELLKEIEARKGILADRRAYSSDTYPAYFDELLEHGLIHLYDHILEMRTLENREERQNQIKKKNFSDICHIVLEARSAILDRLLSLLPKNYSDIVLLVGNTGSGKSTTFRFLKEDQLVLNDEDCYDSPDHPGFIGHEGAISQTFLPNVSFVGNRVLVDFPGFNDTHGPLVSLGTELALRSFVFQCSPKILVMASILSTEDRGAAVHTLGERLSRLLGEKNKNLCLVGITKYTQNTHFNKIQELHKKLKRKEKQYAACGSQEDKKQKGTEIKRLKALIGKKQDVLAKQEASLCSELGVTYAEANVIRLDNLSDTERLRGCQTVLLNASRVVLENVRMDLESSCKEHIIEYLLESNLKPRIQDPKLKFRPVLKESQAEDFEHAVLESSLTNVIFSESHPEIGAFLHLPEMPSAIVHEFDRGVVKACITDLIRFTVNKSRVPGATNLVEKTAAELKDKVSKEVISALTRSWEKLRNLVITLEMAEEVTNEKEAQRAWQELEGKYRQKLNDIAKNKDQEWELPTWAAIALAVPVGIPYAIRCIWAKMDKNSTLAKATIDEAEKVCLDLTKDFNGLYSALIRFKGLERFILKKDAIEAIYKNADFSSQSLPDLKETLSKKIEKVREIYTPGDWDTRIGHLEEILKTAQALGRFSHIDYLSLFMIVALEDQTKLVDELVSALEKEGLSPRDQYTLQTILNGARPMRELESFFRNAWGEVIQEVTSIFPGVLYFNPFDRGDNPTGLGCEEQEITLKMTQSMAQRWAVADAPEVVRISREGIPSTRMERAALWGEKCIKEKKAIVGVDFTKRWGYRYGKERQQPAPGFFWVSGLLALAKFYNDSLGERMGINLNNPLFRTMLQAVLMKNSPGLSEDQ